MKHLANPYISVVIPALNEADYLPQTLKSLNTQTYRNFEVIVADNGSTDQTVAIARHYGAKVVVENQAGVCAARDAGTKAARGQIIVSTDADTSFGTDWLAKYVAAFADPQVVLATAQPVWSDAPSWHRLYIKALFGFVRCWHKLTGRLCYASAGNLAFRASCWQGYNTNLKQGGDEFYVVKQLKPHGSTRFLTDNPVTTSSRRIKRGLLYTLVMTLLVYYVGDYLLSRLTKRSLLAFPEIRGSKSQRAWGWKAASFAIVLFSLLYTLDAHPAIAHAIGKRSSHLPGIHRLAQRFDHDGHRF